jgi:predicted Ser/Thr protein kinase
MIADLSYDDACSNSERVLAKGKPLKAEVFVTAFRGCRFVIKDFGKKGFWERNLIGRLIIRREIRAYRALSGVKALPAQSKRLSPFAIAVEYLDGRDLGGIDRGEIGADVIRQFEAVVQELHERGWVHLDLQRRSNILLVGGKIFIVDLASAFHPGGVPLIGRCLTALAGLADRMSLVKMKSLYAPELLSNREKNWLKLRNLSMPRKW